MKLEEQANLDSSLAIEKTENVTSDYSPGKNVPWWVKFGSKLILARLPVPYAVWRKLGIFKHGRSDAQWSRERKFATECIEIAKKELGRPPRTVLELGPGDSFVGAIVSAADALSSGVARLLALTRPFGMATPPRSAPPRFDPRPRDRQSCARPCAPDFNVKRENSLTLKWA